MKVNRIFFKLAAGFFIVSISLLLLPSLSFAQNDTPCDCVQRWTGGSHWNSDETINDLTNAPPENGIVRCGSSAETQSNVQSIVNDCNYDSTVFNIDISGIGCVDPSSGNLVSVANPTQDKAILWVNFDVRPNAGSFQIQIQDNQDIGWALYYSTVITSSVSLNSNGTGDSISGSCSNLLLVACGIESGSTWNTIPVPNFLETTNYYMALWDETPPPNNNLAVNNFKARFGCGGADVLICNIHVTTPPITVCNPNGTYTVRMPVDGINGEFYAYDPNAINAGGLSAPICLTNPSTTNVISDTLELTYNYGTNYNILVFEANDTIPPTTVTPSGICDDPISSEGCRDTVSGSAPNCCILIPSMSSTDITCNGLTDGTATVSVTGGVAPFTYLWSDGQTTQTATGLSTGLFTVLVSDSNACTAIDTAIISEPALLTVNCVVDSNVTCNGLSDGGATVTANGGTPIYSYTWSNGQTNASAINLSAGTYTVTVSDASLCTSTCSITITEPLVFTAGCAVDSNVSCGGLSDGGATVTPNGIASPFTYLWSNSQTNASAVNLAAGIYTVTVTDANLCTTTCSVTITEPVILACSIAGTNVDCNGNSTGAANLSVTGGTAGFTFLWSTAETTENITGLSAGTYTVTVTDANLCTTTCSVTITEPVILACSIAGTNVDCNGNSTGGADLSVTGGTAGYTYLWSNAATTEDLTGLSAGIYTVTVTDANLCTTTCSVTITEPATQIVLSTTQINILCFGAAAGTIDLTISGGTPSYDFLWSNSSSIEDISGLTAGTYTVTVTDANGCTETTSASITQLSALALSSTQINVFCVGSDTGSINLSVSGGTPSYIFLWSNAETTEDINGLVAGTYTATVTDANGCTETISATITEPGGPPCPAPNIFITNGLDSLVCGDTNSTIFNIGPVGIGNGGPIPITIINTGNDTLIITALIIGGPDSSNFKIPPPVLALLPISLAPSDSINFSIIFTPGGQGSKNGTLTIISNDPNNGNCDAPVGGRGVLTTVIQCPSDTVIEWGFSTDTSVTGIATEIASGDTTVVITFSDTTIITSICPNIRRIERTWIVIDSLGNGDSCVQIIQISDTTAPTAVCQNISIHLDSTGSASITADTIDGGSIDNCGIDSIYIDISNFNCSQIGANNVMLYVVDSCGLIDSCVANVTVLDTSSLPNAGADNLNNIICSTSSLASSINLTSYLSSADTGGIWTEITSSGVDISDPGNVNMSNLPSAMYSFQYTVQSFSGCQTDSATVGIIINNTNCSQFPWNGE